MRRACLAGAVALAHLAGLLALSLGPNGAAADTRIGPRGQVFVDGNAVVPLAVWDQPQYLFEYHANLGVTCIVSPDRQGPMFRLTHPDALTAAAANRLGLIDGRGRSGGTSPQVWGYNAAVLQPGRLDQARRAAEWYRQRDPNRFVMVNIDAHLFLDGREPDFYRQALRHTDAVISHVWPEIHDPNRPNLRLVGEFVDRLRGYCKDRPGGEVSIWPDINPHQWKRKDSQGGTWYPAPTRAELRFQVWLALIHGADGICLFPISFDPFVYAQIPSDGEREIMWNAALIARMTPALTAEESSLPIEVSTDRRGGILDVTTRRTDPDNHFVFVLNGQREPQKITLKVAELGRRWALIDAIGERPLAVSGGQFTEELPGLALRIWELRPAGKPAAASRPAAE